MTIRTIHKYRHSSVPPMWKPTPSFLDMKMTYVTKSTKSLNEYLAAKMRYDAAFPSPKALVPNSKRMRHAFWDKPYFFVFFFSVRRRAFRDLAMTVNG